MHNSTQICHFRNEKLGNRPSELLLRLLGQRKNWPIEDLRVPTNDPRNNFRTRRPFSRYINTHFQNELSATPFLTFLCQWILFEWEYKIFFISIVRTYPRFDREQWENWAFSLLVLQAGIRRRLWGRRRINSHLDSNLPVDSREADLKMISIPLYFMHFGAKDLFIDPICCNFCMVCPCVWGWFWPVLYIFFARHQLDTWTLAH